MSTPKVCDCADHSHDHLPGVFGLCTICGCDQQPTPASSGPTEDRPPTGPGGPAEGRGESDTGSGTPVNAPAPLAELIDRAWDASCHPQPGGGYDQRSPGELARDVIVDPTNRHVVAGALTEEGLLVFAGCWLDPAGGHVHWAGAPRPYGAQALYVIPGEGS